MKPGKEHHRSAQEKLKTEFALMKAISDNKDRLRKLQKSEAYELVHELTKGLRGITTNRIREALGANGIYYKPPVGSNGKDKEESVNCAILASALLEMAAALDDNMLVFSEQTIADLKRIASR